MRLPPPPADRLPDGFVVRLAPGTQRRDGGTTLLGGSPFRQLRLAPAARPLLRGDRLQVDGPRSAALAARLLDAGIADPEVAPAPFPEVTVVVPVKDRTDGLARLLAALRADGHAAVVSGAGPCVLTLAVLGHDEHVGDPASAAQVRELRGLTPEGWECLPLRVDHTGAVVTPLAADHDAVSFGSSGTRP
ncbi:hypothetical protein [Modestobacter versicolor]|uniref:Uncharacterized protein n=1 Tax=Modestobacter versicolor TaxID=429133 RepID=A0A323V584_9ACTN|nr:hypothetical protein [Modestobacter versicolor]PZA19969.1 hypothetical protein DMO24_17870 [Modestobacter versicolor]